MLITARVPASLAITITATDGGEQRAISFALTSS
jgi:hypothetical protein